MKREQFKSGDLVYWIHDEAPCINVFICTASDSEHVALLVRPSGEVRWQHQSVPGSDIAWASSNGSKERSED